MKRFFCRTAAALLAAVLLYPANAVAVSAQKAIVMDALTGQVLYEKRADEKSLIASTTKMMTALLICEECNVLDCVTVPKEAVGVEGSSMYLQEGEILSVQELLYGLMLCSGNDAAVALALYCSGSLEAFADLMNEKAGALGMENTHFSNPHGLDAPEHYSTARDLAILACYAMENPVFAKTVSAKQIQIGDRYLVNHNKLLWQAEGVDGVKTGFTKAAGRILVSSAVRCGRRLVVVTIDDGNDWFDHKALYETCYSNFSVQKLVEFGEIVGTAEVFGGESSCVELVAAADFSYSVMPGEQIEIRIPVKDFFFAPVVQGADAGKAYIRMNGKTVGSIPLVFGSTVEQMQMTDD